MEWSPGPFAAATPPRTDVVKAETPLTDYAAPQISLSVKLSDIMAHNKHMHKELLYLIQYLIHYNSMGANLNTNVPKVGSDIS